ncbi:5548_t:CDS:2 [Gigaspora margarita]|uniref:5548_t:CDS:1 n=1 Tax=Gigaspora margarita TaxID=4874 RepID=A0ABN7V2G3_GIGMA|nr:5548_t:CDS:2 [Gigaspora margarita]
MAMTPSGWCNDCEIYSITLKRYEKLVQQKIQQLADIEEEDILVQEKIRLTRQDIRNIQTHETRNKSEMQDFIEHVPQNEDSIFMDDNDVDELLRGTSNTLQVPPPTKSYKPMVPAAFISNIPRSISQESLRETLEREFGKVLGLTVWEYHENAHSPEDLYVKPKVRARHKSRANSIKPYNWNVFFTPNILK